MRAQKCATLLAFPWWERHIPSMGACHSQHGNVTLLRYFRSPVTIRLDSY